MQVDMKAAVERLATAKVVVVDDEGYMRRVVRTLLLSMGLRAIYEAEDAPSGLEMIRSVAPDAVILDWEMPGLDGTGFMRMLRSPTTFPYPDVPVIMLTGHSERSRVIEAVKLGVNEFLLKPVSSKTLQERLITVLTRPRPVVQAGNYYGPVPRRLIAGVHADDDRARASLFLVN